VAGRLFALDASPINKSPKGQATSVPPKADKWAVVGRGDGDKGSTDLKRRVGIHHGGQVLEFLIKYKGKKQL